MAPLKRWLCYPDTAAYIAAKAKRDNARATSSKRKAVSAPKTTIKKPATKKARTKTKTIPNDNPPQPGLTLEALAEDLSRDSEDDPAAGPANREEKREGNPPLELIAGVDLGTTFSCKSSPSIAFTLCHQKKYSDITVVNDWPLSPSSGVLEKVPTIYSRPEDNPYKKWLWGYELQVQLERHCTTWRCQSWFKLLMAVNGSIDDFEDPLLKDEVGKNLIHLPKNQEWWTPIRDFYRIMYAYALEMVTRRFDKEFVEDLSITWIVSHPADYNDGQKRLTNKAAQEALIESREKDKGPNFITEPAAAAIFIITESLDHEKGRSPFKEKSIALILDLGGGTIDAKSYKIARTNPVRLDDAGTGTAKWVGATSVYRAFVAFCMNEFGEIFTSLPAEKTQPGSSFARSFEDVMRSFNGEDEEETFKVPLVAMLAGYRESGRVSDKYDEDEGAILFSSQDMYSFFTVLIEGMYAVVDEQNEMLKQSRIAEIGEEDDGNIFAGGPAMFRAIGICGGIVSCPYVSRSLAEYCKNNFTDVQIRKPRCPWSATVRGMVLHGLQPHIIVGQKFQHHLGIEVSKAFVAGRDRERETYVDPVHGKRTTGFLQLLVIKGQTAPKPGREVSKFDASVGLEGKEVATNIEVKLYSCARNEKPDRIDSPGVSEVGTVKFECRRLQGDMKTKNDQDRKAISKVIVRAEVSKNHPSLMRFVVKDCKGTHLGEAEVDFYTTTSN